MTNRLSASIATWSQVSPLRSSAESVGSQFFSFLATNAHFSSNWASRVFGGKSDELVVKVAGVLAGQSAQTTDRAAIHLAKSTGLADATPLGDVVQDRRELLGRQSRAKVGRPLPLGKADLANAAPEHASLLMRAVATGHGQISGPPPAMLGAVGIEAAEPREILHVAAPPVRS
jgi:hypothetical protein